MMSIADVYQSRWNTSWTVINRCTFYCIINTEYRDSGRDLDINSSFCDSIWSWDQHSLFTIVPKKYIHCTYLLGTGKKKAFHVIKKKPRKHANKFFLTCKNSKKWHLVHAFELNSSSRPLCCHGASWIKRLNYKSG